MLVCVSLGDRSECGCECVQHVGMVGTCVCSQSVYVWATTKHYVGRSIKYSSLYSQVQSVPRLLFPPRITDRQKQNYKESGGQTGGRKVGTTENKKTTGDWWKSYTCNVACFIFRSGWVDGLLNVWMEGGMVGG